MYFLCPMLADWVAAKISHTILEQSAWRCAIRAFIIPFTRAVAETSLWIILCLMVDLNALSALKIQVGLAGASAHLKDTIFEIRRHRALLAILVPALYLITTEKCASMVLPGTHSAFLALKARCETTTT